MTDDFEKDDIFLSPYVTHTFGHLKFKLWILTLGFHHQNKKMMRENFLRRKKLENFRFLHRINNEKILQKWKNSAMWKMCNLNTNSKQKLRSTYLFYLKRIKLIISYFVFTNKQFWLINYNQVIFFLYCSVLHMYNTFHLHRFSCTAYTTIYIEH